MRRKEPVCGTYSMYKARGCRCDDCRRANREYKQMDRQRKRDGHDARSYFTGVTPQQKAYLKEFDRHLLDPRWDRSWMDDLIRDLGIVGRLRK